jgi:hypothetical protein
VGLGSWLSGRSQANLQRQAQLRSDADAKREAYVEFLAALRRFRRFLLTAPVKVSLRETADSSGSPVAIVEGADAHWDTVEHAISRLWIVTGYETATGKAADKVIDAFYEVARQRAAHGPEGVPAEVIEASRCQWPLGSPRGWPSKSPHPLRLVQLV